MNVNGWQYIPFTKAAKIISDEGKRVKQRNYLPAGKVPVIDQGQEFIGGYVNDENMLFKGDLPIIIFGDHTRNIKFVNRPFAVGAEGVKILKPDPSYEPKFFYYFLHTLDVPSRGYSRHFQFLRKFDVPFAPLDQQKLIVAEIEKQFSRLDEAVVALKRIQANLKRYKASVLKAAVEGKLTEQWRKEHPDVEPASELLKRILVERKKKWERKNPGKKYKEPATPDTSILPELPKGWVWARLDGIAALKGGITVDKNRKDPTARLVPYLRVANVQRGFLDLHEVKEIEAPAADIEELRLITGDILFNEGGDRDKLGRGWIWESQLPLCIHQNHVFRARLFVKQMSPKLISWWGNSFGKDYFLREGKQTTNLASVNLSKLSEFPVPLLPISEQRHIVAEVERLLSVAEEIGTLVVTNLKRADRLRQSILKKVFEGNLI